MAGPATVRHVLLPVAAVQSALTRQIAEFGPVVVSDTDGAPDALAFADAPIPSDFRQCRTLKPHARTLSLAVTVTVIARVVVAGAMAPQAYTVQ